MQQETQYLLGQMTGCALEAPQTLAKADGPLYTPSTAEATFDSSNHVCQLTMVSATMALSLVVIVIMHAHWT